MTTTGERASARVGRRTLVHGAVWTVPVVATAAAAPAFAASCGQLTAGMLDWGANYARASTSAGTATMSIAGGEKVTATITSSFKKYTAVGTNFAVTDGQIGGTGKRGFTMIQRVDDEEYLDNSNYYQLVQISFSRKVYGLKFTMTDVDSATNDFVDAIAVYSDGSWTATKPNGLTGSGTTASPFRPSGTNTAVDNSTGTAGNINFTFSGSVQNIYFVYWNKVGSIGNGIDPDQAVFLGPLSFTAYPSSSC